MPDRLLILVASILIWLVLVLGAQSKEVRIGTWKLASAEDTAEKGVKKATFGKDHVGFLPYAPDDRKMAIIPNRGRESLSVPDYIAAPPELRAAAFSTFSAYAGRYTCTSDTVVYRVVSLQNRVATDLTRAIVKLEQNRLILRTPSLLKGGAMAAKESVWARLSNGETPSREPE